MSHRLRFFIALCLLLLVSVAGTIGYVRIAGLSIRDALYQTIITVTTVGHGDIVEDPNVRPFTTVLAAVGAVNMMVVISLLTVFLVEEQVLAAFGRRKVEKQVERLANHVVVCGYGRFGQATATELHRHGSAFVVIEHDRERARHARNDGHTVLEADATEEQSLLRAGIERAKTLLTVLGKDADNVYVILTARQRKADLLVIAVAREERAETKLRAAGATRVISPYHLGAVRMARTVEHPTVSDFLEMATGANPLDFFMEEQRLRKGSALVGSTLRDSPIRSQLGVIVVGLQRADGAMLTNPDPDTVLAEGDVLVSLGPRDALDRLDRMAGP